MSLKGLPDEILLKIVEHLPKSKYKLRFAQTCKHVRDAAIEGLYSSLIFGTINRHGDYWPEENGFKRLVLKLRQEPHLVQSTRRFSLVLFKIYEDVDNFDDKVQFVLNLMPNLRSLSIEGPFEPLSMYKVFDKLQELEITDKEDMARLDRRGGDGRILHLDCLQAVFRLPMLRRLCINSSGYIDEESLFELAQQNGYISSSSPVDIIQLCVANLSHVGIKYMIEASAGLEVFSIRPSDKTRSWDRSLGPIGPNDPDSVNRLPNISYTIQELGKHASTLRSLSFGPFLGQWDCMLESSSTLRRFTSLQTLRISLETLLGWIHCEHHGAVGDVDQQPTGLMIRPEYLSTLLPSSLQKLTLNLEQFHNYRNGGGYLYMALASIKAEKARLNKLTDILILNGHEEPEHAAYDYCHDCTSIAGEGCCHYFTMSEISLEERDAIFDMLEGVVNVSFELIDTHLYWSDAELEYVLPEVNEDT